MEITDRIDRMLDLSTKGELTEFAAGEWLEHKKLGAKAKFIRDVGGGKIEIEREKDKKHFRVSEKEWAPIRGKTTTRLFHTKSMQLRAGLDIDRVLDIIENVEFDQELEEFLQEQLKVSFKGMKGSNIMRVGINGKEYGYRVRDPRETERKFKKMMGFSPGRALAWLKKNSELAYGGQRKYV